LQFRLTAWDSVYFAQGNIALRNSNFESAEVFYQKGLELQQERNKTDLLNVAFLYKQACVKMSTGNLDSAR
jgi:hypothetical protein